MQLPRAFRIAALLVLVMAGTARAQGAPPLRLARLFQDGMVLQRGGPVPVWGWAPAGAVVTATLAGHTARGAADGDGRWTVRLPAMTAGSGHTLEVAGAGMRVTVRDVAVGDVWVASGQSNMEWPLAQAARGAVAVAAARDPLLREFAVPHTWGDTPADDLAGGSWAAADPRHAGRFSAVGYFFARDLRASTGVPIGIIHTSWGGANIETWMSREALGLGDSAWNALVARERGRDAAIRDSLEEILGTLPTTDPGLVDGRAVWADPALDETGWGLRPVPSYWETTGLNGLDGVAWYRTAFVLTEEEARLPVRISLGRIDDDDITWVNGTEVGRTTGYAERRAYTVPPSALRAGDNVIAVRVADGGGNGGPYGDPADFYLQVGPDRRALDGAWKFRVGTATFQPDGQRINKIPSFLYNRMLHPILRYPIKGVIWYQGESNANNDAQAAAYRALFTGLIRGWRREWTGARGDFPFLWVQLPNFGAPDTVPPARAGWATLRESQTAALALPNTGQVVAIDLGDPGDIHPRDKEPVGARLARVARRVAYGERLVASGPTYRRHTVRGREVDIDFEGDLATSGTPRGFALAGVDRRWVWADARVVGNTVVVSSPQVPNPVAVRYQWSNSPQGAGLRGRDGLPARPFRTDDW